MKFFKRVSEVRLGDLVDLNNDPYADPHGRRMDMLIKLGKIVGITRNSGSAVLDFEGFGPFIFPETHPLLCSPSTQ